MSRLWQRFVNIILTLLEMVERRGLRLPGPERSICAEGGCIIRLMVSADTEYLNEHHRSQ